MKSFFQRIHDSHAGTRKPAEPFQVWEPPKLESERKRQKAGRSEFDHGHATPKSEEKRRSSRPPDAHHEARMAPSTYGHATLPTAGKAGPSRGHYSTIGKTDSLLPSESNSKTYSHRPLRLPSQSRTGIHEENNTSPPASANNPSHHYGVSRYSPFVNPTPAPEVWSTPSQPLPKPKRDNIHIERQPREAEINQDNRGKQHNGRGGGKGDEMERKGGDRGEGESDNKEKARERQRGRDSGTRREKTMEKESEKNKGRVRYRDGERGGESTRERLEIKDRGRERPRERERARPGDMDKDNSEYRGRDKRGDKEKEKGTERDRNKVEDPGQAINQNVEEMQAKRESEKLERKTRRDREAREEREREKVLEREKTKVWEEKKMQKEKEKEASGVKTQDRQKERSYRSRDMVYDGERERGREHDRVKTDGRNHNSMRPVDSKDRRDLEKYSDKDGKDRHSERAKGRDHGKTDSTQAEHRAARKLKVFLEPKKEDGGSSDSSPRTNTQTIYTHRRYRTEEGTSSTIVGKKPLREPSAQSLNPTRQPLLVSHEVEHNTGTAGDAPETQALFVHHRTKESSQDVNLDLSSTNKQAVLQLPPSSNDTDAMRNKDINFRTQNLSIETRVAHLPNPSGFGVSNEIHTQQSQDPGHNLKDKLAEVRTKETRGFASKWQTSQKEISPISQPTHLDIVPSSRSNSIDKSAKGSEGHSPLHFVSIRAAQGPPDPSAHTIPKPAAPPQTSQPTTKSPGNMGLPKNSTQYSEMTALHGEPDRQTKRNETTSSIWQEPTRRAENSEYTAPTLPSHHTGADRLPGPTPIYQVHVERDFSNQSTQLRGSSEHSLSQQVEVNSGQFPLPTSSQEKFPGRISAIQADFNSSLNPSIHLSKVSEFSPSYRTIPTTSRAHGTHSLSQSERLWPSGPEGVPVSNKATQRPSAMRVSKTHLAPSSRVQQDDGLNIWNTKTIANPQLQSPISFAGLNPINNTSAVEKLEPHTSSQSVPAHSANKTSRSLSGPQTIVPHLIAKYEIRNHNDILEHPSISTAQTNSTPVPKLNLADKQKQSPLPGLSPTLPRSISNQSYVKYTGDVDRAYASDTVYLVPQATTTNYPAQTHTTFGSRHDPNYSHREHIHNDYMIPSSTLYFESRTSALTNAIAAPPADLSLRDILSNLKPPPSSTLHDHSTNLFDKITKTELKSDSHLKLSELPLEESKPTLSHPSSGSQQSSLRDVSNQTALERGSAHPFVSEKIEHTKSNVPSTTNYSLDSIRNLINERDTHPPSGEVGNVQRQNPEKTGNPVRAVQQLQSLSGRDGKIEHEHPRIYDKHRLPQSTRSSEVYSGSGSKREGKDGTQLHFGLQANPSTLNIGEQDPLQTTLFTPSEKNHPGVANQTYRPPIQHSILADILSSATPPVKYMPYATPNMQNRKISDPPPKTSHDQFSSKFQAPSPESPPLSIPKSRGSPQAVSDESQYPPSRDDMPISQMTVNQVHNSTSRRHPNPVLKEGSQYIPQVRTSSRAPEAPKPGPAPSMIETSNSHRLQSTTTATPTPTPDPEEFGLGVTGMSAFSRSTMSVVASNQGHVNQPQKINSSFAIRTSATHPTSSSIDRSQPGKRYDASLQRLPSRNRMASSAHPTNHILPDSISLQNSPQPPSIRHDQPTSLPSTLPALIQSHSIGAISPLTSSHPVKISETRPPSEASILKTPSSLAPSALKPTFSRTSLPTSITSQDSRKKGLFSMFRSKPRPLLHDAYEVWHPSGTPQKTDRKQSRRKAESPKNSVLETQLTSAPPFKGKADIDPVPLPTPLVSGRKSPNSKVFTPFRYLTPRRNRTVSVASVEAQDGTAPNTVVGSPTASLHSQTLMQPPPLRDPLIATREWRKLEAAEVRARGDGRVRRQRPGVVFDVEEDPLEDKRSKPMRTRTYAGSRSN